MLANVNHLVPRDTQKHAPINNGAERNHIIRNVTCFTKITKQKSFEKLYKQILMIPNCHSRAVSELRLLIHSEINKTTYNTRKDLKNIFLVAFAFTHLKN